MAVGLKEAGWLNHKMWFIRNAYRLFTPHKFFPRRHIGLIVGDLGLALGETGVAIVIPKTIIGAGDNIDAG
jgi:hypothetical protein